MPTASDRTDLFALVRLPILIAITVIYNAIGVSLIYYFWDHPHAEKVIISGFGYVIFGTLLALRFSRRLQRWILKIDYRPEHLIPRLTFPLILWLILPTVVLFLPL